MIRRNPNSWVVTHFIPHFGYDSCIISMLVKSFNHRNFAKQSCKMKSSVPMCLQFGTLLLKLIESQSHAVLNVLQNREY